MMDDEIGGLRRLLEAIADRLDAAPANAYAQALAAASPDARGAYESGLMTHACRTGAYGIRSALASYLPPVDNAVNNGHKES